MSKKDLVRDGRLQAPKKRTDRSYLKTSAAPAAIAEPDVIEAEEAVAEAEIAASTDPAPAAASAAPMPAPAPAAASTSTAAAASTARHTGAVRALEQQGVRKRRELDVEALAKRDSDYAKHELRRIFTFAALILAALVVIAIFVV